MLTEAVCPAYASDEAPTGTLAMLDTAGVALRKLVEMALPLKALVCVALA